MCSWHSILQLTPAWTLASAASSKSSLRSSSRTWRTERSSSRRRTPPEAAAGREAFRVFQDLCDEAAPSEGLEVTTAQFVSQPDGNAVESPDHPTRNRSAVGLRVLHPWRRHGHDVVLRRDVPRAGGSTSPPTGSPSSWSTSATASSPRRPPRWRPSRPGSTTACRVSTGSSTHADDLRIDPARIVVAGESGGGNLTLATGLKLKRDGDLGLIKGLYALCPYIAGQWPTPECPSSHENEGLLLRLHNNRGRIGYGIEAFNERNPLAWPSFASVDDVTGFPPTVINVNECDPLRDEGINFYRLLLSAGVAGPLPPDDGDDARDRDLRHRLPRTSAATPPGTSPASPANRGSSCRCVAGRCGYAHPPCHPTPQHLHATRARVRPTLVACGALLALLATSPAGAKSAPGVARAALPPGKINHILVIELENEGYAATFGPGSPGHLLERHPPPER